MGDMSEIFNNHQFPFSIINVRIYDSAGVLPLSKSMVLLFVRVCWKANTLDSILNFSVVGSLSCIMRRKCFIPGKACSKFLICPWLVFCEAFGLNLPSWVLYKCTQRHCRGFLVKIFGNLSRIGKCYAVGSSYVGYHDSAHICDLCFERNRGDKQDFFCWLILL